MEVSLRGAEQLFLKIMKRKDGIRDEESKEVNECNRKEKEFLFVQNVR